ncbi:MAG TPA: hypothetical protein VMU02_10880 [bacterium]|nr:hypothetical protein [bacterium]
MALRRRADLLRCFALIGLILAAAGRLCAADVPTPATELSPTPLTKTWVPAETQAGPIGQWRLGGALRLRYIDLANVTALGLEPYAKHQVARVRTQVSVARRFSPTLRLFGELANESSKYVDCDSCRGGFDEIIVDNLYLEAVRPHGLPIGVRLGRQNLFYGDGFLIADGTPLDESRTTYVNGLLITTTIPLWSLDFFAARDPHRDEYLPRINNRYTRLSETDDFLWGIFMERQPAPGTALRYTFGPYYVYKSEKNGDRMALIHTMGARLGFGVRVVEVAGEVAYQGGKVPAYDFLGPDLEEVLAGSQSVSALGGHARLTGHLASLAPLDIEGGYVYLTGDDRKTRNKYEGWNPLLGRWPMWSELYIYTLAVEALPRPLHQGIAYWQNLKMPYIRVSYAGNGPVTFEAKYCWLDAFEDLTIEPTVDPSYEGPTHRGELVELKLGWNSPRLFSGHVVYERFMPGDFYNVIEGFVPKDASYFRLEVSRVF